MAKWSICKAGSTSLKICVAHRVQRKFLRRRTNFRKCELTDAHNNLGNIQCTLNWKEHLKFPPRRLRAITRHTTTIYVKNEIFLHQNIFTPNAIFNTERRFFLMWTRLNTYNVGYVKELFLQEKLPVNPWKRALWTEKYDFS